MTSSVARTFPTFPAPYSPHQGSRSPSSPKLFDPYQSANFGNGTPCFSDTQLLHYAVPPLPMAPRSLPGTQNPPPHNVDARDRSIPLASPQFSDFGRSETHCRQPSLESRTDNSYRPSPENGELDDSKPSLTNAGLSFQPPVLRSLDLNETAPTTSMYSPSTQATSRSADTPMTPGSSAWFAFPTLEPCSADHHPACFAVRSDLSPTYTVRSPFPTLSQSVPPSAHPDPLPFNPHHSFVHVPGHAGSPQQSNGRSSSSAPSSPDFTLQAGDNQFLHSYEPHPTEWCGFENESRRGSIGPTRVDLAPLHALQRSHPYRRDPIDDKALRLLGPRSS
jgi:hypothetical protein